MGARRRVIVESCFRQLARRFTEVCLRVKVAGNPGVLDNDKAWDSLCCSHFIPRSKGGTDDDE